jgi:hypothetical protein
MFPVDQKKVKVQWEERIIPRENKGGHPFLFRIYNIDFLQYGWLHVPLHQFKSRSLSMEVNILFPTSQGYIKSSCNSFLSKVAMYVYKVVNGSIGFLFYSDKSCICS